MKCFQCKKDQWMTEIRFLLVVYREVTMNFLYGEEQHQFAKVFNENANYV